ncbi:MAG: molybdate ABC transporter substrate-binding protein [Desulforegulaceae bacterium]|nr:molybdate ABC transporter substrate-binding protein [Desulforegulaceae bacterium]
MKKTLIVIFYLHLIYSQGFCEELKVACAINFIVPMKLIIKNFEKENNHKITATFGSMGMLYGQIINKVDFDVFFAADIERPENLINNGKASNFFLYAKGKSFLWTKSEKLKNLKTYEEIIEKSKTISITMPNSAPYGKVVYDLLAKKNLLKDCGHKLVYAKNVSQSFQYAFSGLTDSCFCVPCQVLSKKGRTGIYICLDEAKPVIQGGCILKTKKLAYNFVEYVKKSDNILKKYGYEIP